MSQMHNTNQIIKVKEWYIVDILLVRADAHTDALLLLPSSLFFPIETNMIKKSCLRSDSFEK